jgi:D-apionolactonase
MTAPTREIMLFGTDEPVTPPVLLQAGPLTAELDEGNLRYIRFHGREMLRAISFIVRDKNWGTYRPAISHLKVDQDDGGFKVTYDAVAGDADQSLRYAASITGDRDGSLIFAASGETATDFLTNRTGFVVLHPIEGVAGKACTLEHVNGRTVTASFPDLIDPVQPMMELRSLTHQFAPGFKVTCRMEGDTFEMEDQRNWTDASYKTYVRPLALPWPYTLAKGERIEQRVSLTVAASPRASLRPRNENVSLTFHATNNEVPPLGFGLEPKDTEATLAAADRLRSVQPHHIVVSHDPGLGHNAQTLAKASEAARTIGAGDLWLEAVVRSVKGFEAEIAELGRIVQEIGSPFSTVLVSPAPDLKCTLPGSPWPPCPPLADLYRAARRAFPSARLGGGMFSFFTELNRKRPPVELLDIVTFTTSSIFHAGDDRSATEGLESLPAIARTVRSFIQDRPYHVGPSAIGMRANPYGEAPTPNPHNIRQAGNGMDPRQRGLLAAAWTVGYFAHFARGGAAAITLGGGTGDFGLVHTNGTYAKPWYDENSGFYPVFHVFKGLSALGGKALLDVQSSEMRVVQGIGSITDGSRVVLLANLPDFARDV